MSVQNYLRNKIFSFFSYENVFFSQEGEDIILRTIFLNKSKGFFVDVGAHDPIYLSNTYYFYLNGWRGINIDINPSAIEKFNRVRPEDINLKCAVGLSSKRFYYMFDKPAVNTVSETIGHELITNPKHKVRLVKKIVVNIVPLKNI